MRTLRLRALVAVSALALLASCRDRTESLVGPPEEGASFAETLALKRGAALDLNEAGVAAGWIEGDRAFRWTRGGQLQVLGTLGGNYSRGAFINAAGQVTGVSTTTDGARHVFLWTAGERMRSLGTLGGSELVVTAFSDSGHVVGWGTQANGSTTGFIARAGAPLQLIPGYPLDVNGAGVVVGRTGPGASTAFRWTAGGGAQALPAPWGSAQWQPPQLNEAGVIAGIVTSGTTSRVVRWSPSGGYEEVDDCGTYASGCRPDVLSLNEPGAVAWAGADSVAVWEEGGTVRKAAVVVAPSRVVLSDAGDVAGTGVTFPPAPTAVRSFLWRASGGVAYYSRASQVYAINARGDVVGSGAMQTGKDVGKRWNERPTWFDAAENHPPVATAGGPYEVAVGQPLTLDAAELATDPDGDALRAYWSELSGNCCTFRDYRTGGRSTVTFQWNVPGEYDIALAVADADSLYARVTTRVRVLPATSPSTRLGPYAARAGEHVLLDGRRADDPTGTRYSYVWSVDGGAPRRLPASWTRRFDYADTFPLTLTVRDSVGALVEYVRTQAVIAPHGELGFFAPDSVPENAVFDIRLLGFKLSRNPRATVSYNCGNGVFTPWQTAAYATLRRCPALPRGTVTVAGRIRETPTSPVVEFTRQVVVHPGPPIVRWSSADVNTLRVGQTATGKLSFTSHPSDGPWTYRVTWADGAVTEGTTQDTALVLTHVYTTAGFYTVAASVKNASGRTGSAGQWWYVTVNPVPPSVRFYTVGDPRIAVGQAAVAQLSFSSHPANGPWTYRVAWGDGTFTEGTVHTTAPLELTHVYTQAGYPTARATVTDASGQSAWWSAWWTVRAAP